MGGALIQHVWVLGPRGRETGACAQRSRHSKDMAICKPRREASKETHPTNTLILDLQPPKLWENKLLLLKQGRQKKEGVDLASMF